MAPKKPNVEQSDITTGMTEEQKKSFARRNANWVDNNPGGFGATSPKGQTRAPKDEKKPPRSTTRRTTGTKPPANEKQPTLEENVRKYYPQLSFMLDNPELYGQDVVDIFRRATNPKSTWTFDRFATAIQGTNYWKTTVAAAKNFDSGTEADRQNLIDATLREINGVSEVGSLDQAAVSTFARDMARRGIQGDQLRQMTYQFIFQQGIETQAAEQALFSENAANMRRIAKSYGAILDDNQVRTYLSEGKTPQNLQAMYREKMKAQYPHLAPQLDADLTYEEIIQDYKQLAARVLEKSPDAIDFSKPEYMEAIATRDANGNMRQLSLGEWDIKLKTDDRYGYSKTNTAIQEARTLASSIARSFGRII